MDMPTVPQPTVERRAPLDAIGGGNDQRPWTATRMALAFVAAVLVAILVVPLVIRHRLDALRDEVTRVAEPARQLSEAISRSLAVEVAADRAFQLTSRASFRTRFLEAWQQQELAFQRLTGLAPSLGPDVVARAVALRTAVHEWGRTPLQTLNGSISHAERAARLDPQEHLFEHTVSAATALDDAIHDAAEQKRDQADQVASLSAVVTAGLSALALVALVLVTWLARELRRLAHEEASMRQQLQALYAARDRLIRGFSHDVKNPLGAADGFAALLESGVIREPGKQAEALARIRRSIHGALRLIEDVLELARAEAGQLQFRVTPVDLREVAAEVADEYRAQAEASGMTLTVELPQDLPFIRSDAARIHQILANLLTNAIKYAGAGGAVGVRIGAEARWPRGRAADWLRVEVWDHGPGIPPDSLEEVFDEFTRLGPESRDGAGLGLAISRRLARALGGDLTVESEPGAGARFVLWLPDGIAAAA